MDKNPGTRPSAARGPKGKLKSSFRTTNIGAWGNLSAKENTQKGVFGRAQPFSQAGSHLYVPEMGNQHRAEGSLGRNIPISIQKLCQTSKL